MRVLETVADYTDAIGEAERPLGLVPTMGFLHRGHMALVERARADCASVVVSIFVNPSQFGPSEDFDAYPRDLPADLAHLEGADVDFVFVPTVDEIYPQGFSTYVDVGQLGLRLEGKSRANHFKGVATMVCKLLSLVRPDRAYFGQKDGQQYAVVSRLNADLNLGAEIVVVPTVREADGLAISSRNIYLNAGERRAAPVLYRSLCLARDLNTTDADRIRRSMAALIEDEPLAQVDYVSVADSATLEEVDSIAGPVMVSLAVRIGRARLIDNITLGDRGR